MDILEEFIKLKKDLETKSLDGYEYEVEVRLKGVTEEDFSRLPEISNTIVTEETLYSVKGSSSVTIREIDSDFFIKERISSRMIPGIDAEIVLSLERKYYREQGMALKVKRHKERNVIDCNGFRIDATKVVSNKKTHYEIELEVLDSTCKFESLQCAIEGIRPPATSYTCKQISKLIPSLDIRSYRFPKPVDITMRELIKNYSLGGSVSLKLDDVRSFLVCYEDNVYGISTRGQETIIASSIQDHTLLTVLDTEQVGDMYYAFDIAILKGVVVAHCPLKERVKAILQTCLAINKAVGKKLVVAKRHFMFDNFYTFSRYHQLLEERLQDGKYDGIIYTHSLSYFDPVMCWKPQKTVDLLYQDTILMAYSQGENVNSRFKMSQESKKPREGVVSEFKVNPDSTVSLFRERKDKTYPNSATVVERIRKIAREEGDIIKAFKGSSVLIMRSYHNDVKRELLKKGSGYLLDVGSGAGGDVAKWAHYRSVTCIEPSHTNIVELRRRLRGNKKVRVIQTKVEHLRGLDKSMTTLSCFFCITLIDLGKFAKIAQRVLFDKYTCTFLCTVMSKKHIVEFLKARESSEYVCGAYTIKLTGEDSVYVHIPGTIVADQNENLVDVDGLIALFENMQFKLEMRDRLNKNKFMSHNEYLLSSMYESIVMMIIAMDTKHRTLVLTPMISRTPKRVHPPSHQSSYKHSVQKVEEAESSDVFTYVPQKSSSKERVKYIVSRTVNRNMLVAVDLLKELQSNNSIVNINSSDFESLIIRPLNKFLDGRVVKKPQERLNPFDTPRHITHSFTKLLNLLRGQGIDTTDIKAKDNQSSLSSASKLLRIYISNNLEKHGKRILLDSTLESLFLPEHINELYTKNGDRFITQGQIQKLASLLVTKVV